MEHLRILVHFPPDPVAAIFAHHGIAGAAGVAIDGVTDIAERRTGTDRENPLPHRLIGGSHQPPRGRRDLADQESPAGIGDEAVLFQRDV